MERTTRKITAGLCGIAIAAGSMVINLPLANATVMVTQGVENVVLDSNQQQIVDVFNGINAFRATKGLAPVKFSVPISTVSQNWSTKMASTDSFYHNPSYTAGVPAGWSAGSEIIAARWDRSGQGLVNQWIASPGHNAIMSDPQFNTVGIGVAFTDKTIPADPSLTRYGMYGTANLFRYSSPPSGTYNSPVDYFAGQPPISATPPVAISVTPTAPVFNATARTYTIPAKTGVTYLVNNIAKPAGTYSGIGSVSVIAVASAGYTLAGTSTWSYAFPAPVTEPILPAVKAGDLLAIDAKGVLWNYGNRAMTGRKIIGTSGWLPAKEVFVTDWNSDGIYDVVAQWKTGNLSVYYGTKTGTLAAGKVIGAGGWESYELSIAKYSRADKYPSIIAKDTAGALWQYTNPTGGVHGPRIAKGTGWKYLSINLLDWDKDGNMDIIAKNSAGSLLLYRTDGYGKFKSETRKTIGTGWSNFQMQSITGYTGTGTQGIIAKDSLGTLYYYGTGTGTWLTRIVEGPGWLPMNVSSS